MRYFKNCLFLLLIAISTSGKGQELTNEGTEFFVAFTETFDTDAAIYQINISSRFSTSGMIEVFGTPFSTPFSVTPGIVTSVDIPAAFANIEISETVIERAIHVTSDMPIATYASTFHSFRSEASVVLPVNTIGSDYLISTLPSVFNGGLWRQSEFMVVSGDEASDITIVPSANTESGALAGVPISVHLEPGDIYMVQAAIGSATDLTGTTVIADNGVDKFGVYNGHTWYFGGDCGSTTADPLFEVAYPTSSWGRDYIMTLTEEQDENLYRIVARFDGTTFDLDGVPSGVMLDAGEFYEASLTTESLLINANNPIGVVQVMLTGTCTGNGDPSMILLNSNEQMHLDTIAFYAVDINDIEANYVNIITRTPDIGTINLDGVPVVDWTTLGPDPDFSYKIMEIDTGSHTLETDGCGFLAYTYGVKFAESYFYAAGVRLDVLTDTVTIDNLNASDLCDNDSILFTPVTSGGDVESYSWDFGDGEGSDLENPLHVYDTSGDYVVELIINYKCSVDTITTTINVFNSPVIDETAINVSCFNHEDGSITTLVTEGTPDYMYDWSNGETGPDITDLSGGVYTLIVTDQNGCRDSISVTIDEPGPIDISVDPAGPYAPGDGVQILSASPPGGTWSAECGTCINATTGAFDPLDAGPGLWEVCYTATVGPCDTIQCIEILVDTNCAMVVISNEPTCFGFSDGSFTVNVSGGVAPIEFVFTDDTGEAVNVDNSNTANSLNSGWYFINITDLVCTFNDSIFIGEPEEMVIDFEVIDPLCNGDAAGIVFVDTVINNTGLYEDISYFWAPLPDGNNNGKGEDTLNNVPAGEYVLLINDASGCSQSVEFVVNEPPALEFAEFGFESSLCRVFDFQSGNGVVFASAIGGVPDYNYEWLNLSTLSTTDNSTWGGLNPAVYKITVTDANGCELIDFIELDSINPTAIFETTSPQFLTPGICEGTAVVDVHFENQSTNFAKEGDPTSDTLFSWHLADPPGNWIISEDLFETFDRSYPDSGTYNICLVAFNKNNCVDTTCKIIKVFDKPELILPNIFTPGNDNSNNTFFFPNLGIVEFECVIVNRWGRRVFEFDEITQVWDGTDLNGDDCTAGVYFYAYKAVAANGEEFEGQGNVHLFRDE